MELRKTKKAGERDTHAGEGRGLPQRRAAGDSPADRKTTG